MIYFLCAGYLFLFACGTVQVVGATLVVALIALIVNRPAEPPLWSIHLDSDIALCMRFQLKKLLAKFFRRNYKKILTMRIRRMLDTYYCHVGH